ncbi:MAG: hypothetical protein ACT4OS_04050 [Acidimicrobiales bacterium]
MQCAADPAGYPRTTTVRLATLDSEDQAPAVQLGGSTTMSPKQSTAFELLPLSLLLTA